MPRAFTDQLRDIRRGACAVEATDQLAQLVKAVRDTGKAGSITIEIKVKPASRASGAMFISDKITLKLPEVAANETMLFDTPEGSLVGEDPAQHRLDLRDVSAPPVGELKTVGA